METTEISKKYLTIDEVSKRLNIPKGTIYNYISLGKIPFTKIGHHIRFPIEVLGKWLKQRQYIPK